MAFLAAQNRLGIPQRLMDCRKKVAYMYYSYKNKELYITFNEDENDCLLSKIKFDAGNRFCFPHEILEMFKINNNTELLPFKKGNKIIIKIGPIKF